jgi:ABC-2 type transport system permease protein
VNAVPASGEPREGGIFGELVKIPAFLRRDFLQAWSYRMAFVTDAIGLALQTALFFYISKIVDPSVLPTFGGTRVSYLEYVVVGIAMTMLIALGIFRAAAAFRNEQLMGTLEVLLMTPTAPWTIQIGSIVYDLVYIPLRTGLFIAVVALATDVSFDTDGIVPATVILLAFLPFVWGIGIIYAAASLTFKQVGGGIAITLLTFSSGAYFPLELFPDWLATAAEANPMAVAINAMREALLGGAGWSGVGDALLVLVPASIVMLSFGIGSFLLALRRERRRGTLGIY